MKPYEESDATSVKYQPVMHEVRSYVLGYALELSFDYKRAGKPPLDDDSTLTDQYPYLAPVVEFFSFALQPGDLSMAVAQETDGGILANLKLIAAVSAITEFEPRSIAIHGSAMTLKREGREDVVDYGSRSVNLTAVLGLKGYISMIGSQDTLVSGRTENYAPDDVDREWEITPSDLHRSTGDFVS